MSLQWHHGEQTGPQWNTPVLQEDMVATKVDVAITSLGSMKEAVVQHSATKCDNISSCWAEFGLVFRFRWWIGWRSSHVSNLCSIWLCAVLLEAWCLDCLTKHFIHPWFWNILEGFGIHWSVQVGPILTKRCTEQTSITVRGFFLLQLQVPTLHWTVAFVWQAGLEAVPALLPCCLAALLPWCDRWLQWLRGTLQLCRLRSDRRWQTMASESRRMGRDWHVTTKNRTFHQKKTETKLQHQNFNSKNWHI